MDQEVKNVVSINGRAYSMLNPRLEVASYLHGNNCFE